LWAEVDLFHGIASIDDRFYLSRLNRTFREDVLDAFLFNSLQEVREVTEQWIEEHDAIRPHEALGDVPPYQYALKQP
jgi:putative transposase